MASAKSVRARTSSSSPASRRAASTQPRTTSAGGGSRQTNAWLPAYASSASARPAAGPDGASASAQARGAELVGVVDEAMCAGRQLPERRLLVRLRPQLARRGEQLERLRDAVAY